MLLRNTFIASLSLLSLGLAVLTGCHHAATASASPRTEATSVASNPVPAHWIALGREWEEVTDSETGRTIRYLTGGRELESIQHYHNGTFGFINGVHYLFIESARARPANAPGQATPSEKQLLAINIESGVIYYLTSIPNPPKGEKTQWGQRQYHSAFLAPWHAFIYFDKDFRALHAYDALTGKTTPMLALPGQHNARGRQLSLALTPQNRVRVLYGYSVNPFGDRRTQDVVGFADFNRDFSIHEQQIVRESKIDEAYNHYELRPGDPDWMICIHHHGQATRKTHSPYSDHYTQIVNLRDPATPRVVVNPDNVTVDHQIWSPSGRVMYWDDNRGNLMSIDFETLEKKVIGKAPAIHNHVSPDERLWVYDVRDKVAYESFPVDHGRKAENWRGSIWIYDLTTHANTKYANIVWGDPHPRHPHAQFSTDGKWIAFVTGVDGSVNSRIAIMRVDASP